MTSMGTQSDKGSVRPIHGRAEDPVRTAQLVRLNRNTPLTEDLEDAWRRELRAQEMRGECSGPFLGPEVACAIGRHREDIAILVGFDNGEPIRFLPLHVGAHGRARALGGRFCDQSGPVGLVTPQLLQDMLKEVGLKSWRFARYPLAGGLASRHIWSRSTSRIVEVGEGLDDFRQRRRAQGSRLVDQLLRKERKLEREVGKVRFEFAHGDEQTLDKLLQWKSEQRLETGSVDVFREDWARAALEDLHVSRKGGLLSALWAGESLVAAHFGLADHRILHWWIPTYDRRYGAFSPGLILMLHMIRECHARGIREIDLGHGDERYKTSLATATRELYAGSVDRSSLRCTIGRTRSWAREVVRQSPLESGWVATKQIARRSRFFGQS